MKYSVTLLIAILCCSALHAQIPNGDFSAWGIDPGGGCSIPIGWRTGTICTYPEGDPGSITMFDGGLKFAWVDGRGRGKWMRIDSFQVNQYYNRFRFRYQANVQMLEGCGEGAFHFWFIYSDSSGNSGAYNKYWEPSHNTTGWVEESMPLWFSGDPMKDPPYVGSLNFYINDYCAYEGSWVAIDDLELLVGITLTQPNLGTKWIAGTIDTIKWTGGSPDQAVILEFSGDEGATYDQIALLDSSNGGEYLWDIPDTILTTKGRVRIREWLSGDVLDSSKTFKIKPYLITKIDASGDYVLYDITVDRWGFGNYPDHVWPVSWWLQFNYPVNNDPFTGDTYPQEICDSVFAKADLSDFVDWESFVRAFGTNSCYRHTGLGIYRLPALQYWKAKKHGWNGSCFGIAAANALAFGWTLEFYSAYPGYPQPARPVDVTSDTNVIPVVTELFSHQFGHPTRQHRVTNWTKTPNQTLNDLKVMLSEDNTKIRTLSFWNNGPDGGGHTINAYKLEQDPVDKQFYYLWVWDNAHHSNEGAIITFDTTQNDNKGAWIPSYGWNGWGGFRKILLEVEANNYLTTASLPKQGYSQSPFILSADELEINNTYNADIVITDSGANTTGFSDSTVYENIPGSVPLIATTGTTTPPYGYHLPIGNYSVVMDNFTSDTVEVYFFTGNRSYSFERYDGSPDQADMLRFDGGLSVSNTDTASKIIKLLNIVEDTLQNADKLLSVSNLSLSQGDSVKMENLEASSVKFTSYGTSKLYDISLEYASNAKMEYFRKDGITLPGNSSHTVSPVWDDLMTSDLQIIVDEGNDGTPDDTLEVQNQLTGVRDERESSIPTEYRLGQNYPNPFNGTTVIDYALPSESRVKIGLYNTLGSKVAELMDDRKPAGNYRVTFEAGDLPSGVYFYKLQAGEYVKMKKMVIMK